VLDTYIKLIDLTKESHIEFNILEEFLDNNFDSHRYSKSIIDQVVNTLLKLKVAEGDENGTR
jgi:hypothetical protein